MTYLLCDFDGPLDCAVSDRIYQVARALRVRVDYIRYDRTRRGWHAIVRVEGRRLSPWAIIAAQAVCGSDPHRERFNLGRVARLVGAPAFWRRRWNLLFERHQRIGV